MIGLRRKVAVEPPSPAGVRLTADFAVLLRDSEEAYRRLVKEYEEQGTSADLRAAALHLARKIAAYERLAIISREALLTVPESMQPTPAMAVLQHLSYALVALGQDDPDTGTIVTESELDDLIRDTNAREWLDTALDSVPDDWEAV
jgi:hypothetical protein